MKKYKKELISLDNSELIGVALLGLLGMVFSYYGNSLFYTGLSFFLILILVHAPSQNRRHIYEAD